MASFSKTQRSARRGMEAAAGGAKDEQSTPILWPSERIPQGGLFHSAKVQYSPETADLIKLLMQESRMSMTMRKQINQHLRNGDPLPKPEPPRINFLADPDENAKEILRRARNAKRKSLSKIIASGAYEMPINRPKPNNRIPSDIDKKKLQEKMAGIKLPETLLKPKRKRPPAADVTIDDMINELLDQINERADWLAEMEELGEGKRYRNEVREQIAERLRQIKGLEAQEQLQKQGFRIVD